MPWLQLPPFLRRYRPRGMWGSRALRWVAYFTLVGVLVTWTYISHPARMNLIRPQPIAPIRSAPPMQIAAPAQGSLHKENPLENTPDSAPNDGEAVAASGLGRRQGQILYPEIDVLLPRQVQEKDYKGPVADNDRYKQVIIEQEAGQPERRAGSKAISLEEMREAEKDFRLRSLAVKNTCAKYNLGIYRRATRGSSGRRRRYPPSANYDVLYIDRPDALTWCPVYKAASTSWLHNLCILAGVKENFLKSTKEQISTIARGVWPQLDYAEAVQAVPHTTKFMIVRHPLERLVSAYRDKLENLNIGQEHGVQHFYEAYGKKIVRKYRKVGANHTRVVLDSNPDLPPPRGIEPTFEEFVKYLTETDLVHHSDDHWMPYYLYCTPCYINYDVIAKFETVERDQKYLIQKLNLGDRISAEWKHLTKGRKTSEIVKKYLSTISKEDLKRLVSKYKIDFEMYGYSVSDYL